MQRVLNRTESRQSSERLGLFHQTLVDHLANYPHPRHATGTGGTHGIIADAIDQLAPASRRTPAGYQTDLLPIYAFDAVPRYRRRSCRPEQPVADLAARPDPVSRARQAVRGWAGLR